MKKSIAVLLVAMMQSAFAIQLVDGKYINFEEFVRSTNQEVVKASTLKSEGSCRTVDDYKALCVNGTNSTRRYFTNEMLDSAFSTARKMKGIGVYLPPGVWNFTNQIVVPHGMTLKGSYNRPHHVTKADLYTNVTYKADYSTGGYAYDQNGDLIMVAESVNWDRTTGTNIGCYYGWGALDYVRNTQLDPPPPDTEACIALQGSATLDGVNIYYPQQNKPMVHKTFVPVRYPWTISCQWGVGNPNSDYEPRCSVMNTTLVNSYRGIDLIEANDHYIKGVNMTVFESGIRVDQITSLGVIEDVNIHTQYSVIYYGLQSHLGGDPDAVAAYNNMESYIQNHMIGLEFGWVDWEWLKNVFVFKAKKGFYFRRGIYGYNNAYPGKPGTARAVASIDVQNSGCDLCIDAVYADELNSGIGVNFSNSNLLGRIYSSDENYGPIRFTNSYLEFNAEMMGVYKGGKINFYNQNHVEVGQKTTMQISNSEIMDFVGDDKGLWCGSSFNVKGNLLVGNSSLVWPNPDRFKFVKGKINGVSVDSVMHFRTHSNANLLTNNLLIRGTDKLRVIKASKSTMDTTHTAYDPLSSGYHPFAR